MKKPGIPALLNLLKDRKPALRKAAAEALGRIGDDGAIPALRETGRKDTDKDVRKAAESAIKEIKETSEQEKADGSGKDTVKSDVPSLMKQLRSKDTGKRKEAAETLGESGDGSAAPALVVVLGDRDKEVREAAAEALAKIGKSAVPSLTKLLKSRDPIIRKSAAETLGKIGDKSAIPALRALGKKDPNENVREAAEFAINQIGENSEEGNAPENEP